MATRQALTAFLAFDILLLTLSAAYAQTPANYNTTFGTSLCLIVGYIIFGNLGRGIATVAVITLGISAMLGRVSWSTALIIATGIAVTFGAYPLAKALGAGGVCLNAGFSNP